MVVTMGEKVEKICPRKNKPLKALYVKPVLVNYGSVAVVTAGTAGSGADIPGTTCSSCDPKTT